VSRQVKELMVREIARSYEGIKQTGCVVVDYRGVSAQETVELRRVFKEQKLDIHIVKNSLMALVFKNLGIEEAARLLTGPSAVVKGEDPVTCSKGVFDAIAKLGKMEIRGGVAEGKVIDAASVEKYARMPSLEQLRAQLVWHIAAPIRAAIMAVKAVPQKLAATIAAVRDKMEE